MKNQEVIDQLIDHKNEVMNIINNREFKDFRIKDLDIEESKLVYNGLEFSPSTQNAILNMLRVKPEFLEYRKDFDIEDWNFIKDKLKSASVKDESFLLRVKSEKGKHYYDDLYRVPKTTTENQITIPMIYDEIIEGIKNANRVITIKSLSFLESDNDVVNLILFDNDRVIDAFGNKSGDVWRTGKHLEWNNASFSSSPFLQRLSCANGNTTRHLGYSSNANNKKHNIVKVKSIVDKDIVNDIPFEDALLRNAVQHLKNNRVSIDEFLNYRNLFSYKNESDVKILNEYFNINKFNTAYGCNVEEMPGIWKSTANTGINGYDFFNNLTYIASHPELFDLDNKRALNLTVKSSNFLFKERLDLEMLAPKMFYN
jgi:hypothetical protein